MSPAVPAVLKCAIWRLLAGVMEGFRQHQGRTYITMDLLLLLPENATVAAQQDLLAFTALVWNYVKAEMLALAGQPFPYDAFLRDLDVILGRAPTPTDPLPHGETYNSQLQFSGRTPKSLLETARGTFGRQQRREAAAAAAAAEGCSA